MEYLMFVGMFQLFYGSEWPPRTPEGHQWYSMDNLVGHEKAR